MTKHKVSELEGALLDAAVAKAEGMQYETATARTAYACDVGAPIVGFTQDGPITFNPSKRWAEGGPIIERERIDVLSSYPGWEAFGRCHPSARLKDAAGVYGPAPLIAAMRAYVASKFGDEVELT
ncbi:MAG: DUF2591 domain-containing protein [Paucibacter sp.]|nr:DUF2591 domain-containing protein [Roseateles sp.]